MENEYDLSFVFPCLNEEETMAVCLQELKDVLKETDINYEIVVSDNGSSDKSVEIARAHGARVVVAKQKGYGEALKNGFSHAKGKYIAFADIDGSYPLNFLPQMYRKIISENADMVIASRMTGVIEKGAMPVLHQKLGTPVLTFLINLFFGGHLSDCNSGFRIMNKKSYESWQVQSGGMEFASELLIKALKHKAQIIEIPAGLRPDKRSRAPHLKTWRDGMRHLLFILSEAPKVFEVLGMITFFVMAFLQILAMIFGQQTFWGASIFGYHSQILFIIFAILGLQSWIFSLFLFVFKKMDKPFKLSQYLMNIREENLFLTFLSVSAIMFIGLIYLLIQWVSVHFNGLEMLTFMINFLFFLLVLCLGSFGLLCLHIIKRVIGR